MSQLLKKRVLIIDDSRSDALLAKKFLETIDINCVEVQHDGLEGLNACLLNPPDLLLLDLNLPRIHGEDVLRMIRSSKRLRRLPIFIISEMKDSERREMDLLRIGADRYFSKPFDKTKMLSAIKEILKFQFIPGPESTSGSGIFHSNDEPEEATAAIENKYFIADCLDDLLEVTDELADQSTKMIGGASGAKPIAIPENSEDFQGYRIMEMIGYGGMSTVYKAVQISLGRTVALKVMMKDQRKANKSVSRFREEAKIMATLSHRNIVQIIDAGDTRLTMYIVLEFVPTGTLHDRIKKGGLNREELLSLSIQSCNAISYLHSVGVIHRDIKPGNIFLSPDKTVKVGDFGISRIANIGMNKLDLEGKRQILGTPRFMAPEVLMGLDATEGSDQFSLGRTFMRALAPTLREPTVEDVKMHRKDLPASLFDILSRATHYEPKGRYADIMELKEALIDCLE